MDQLASAFRQRRVLARKPVFQRAVVNRFRMQLLFDICVNPHRWHALEIAGARPERDAIECGNRGAALADIFRRAPGPGIGIRGKSHHVHRRWLVEFGDPLGQADERRGKSDVFEEIASCDRHRFRSVLYGRAISPQIVDVLGVYN